MKNKSALIARVDKSIREGLGRYIESALAHKGITQKKMAERIGISRPHMHRILKGVNFPSDKALGIIASELGMTKRGLLSQVILPDSLADYLESEWE